MSGSSLTRCAVPALVALLALSALAGPAPAAKDGGRPAHATTPSDVERSLAAERYYSSYGDTAAEDVAPVAEAGRDGIGVTSLGLALAGTLVLGVSLGALVPLAHARRRHRVRIAS